MTQAEVATAIGVRREMWAKYEAGAEPGASVLSRVADAGFDIEYVLTGKRLLSEFKNLGKTADASGSGRVITAAPSSTQVVNDAVLDVGGGPPKTYSARAKEQRPVETVVWSGTPGAPLVLPVLFTDSNIRREYQVIDRLGAEASAGRGLGNAREADLKADGIMALDQGWMTDNFGRTGAGFASVTVHGDSMEPTLFNGETIVIDTKISHIDVSGIYVLKAGSNVLVKRVQLKFDGTLVLKSDNKAYEPEMLSPIEAKSVKVQGRMVWPRVR